MLAGKPYEYRTNDRRFDTRYAAEVVMGSDLAVILHEWKTRYLKQRNPMDEFPQGWKANRTPSQVIGPNEYISFQTGIDPRRIFGLMRGEYQTVALSMAEIVLMAIDREYLLDNGTLKVVPNPKWSQEKWISYMEERGCI